MSAERTVYLKRPGDHSFEGSTDAVKDFRTFFYRNRYQLGPLYAASVWYTVATVVERPVPMLITSVLAAFGVYQYGEKLKLRLERYRRYAATAVLVAGAWYGWATWRGDPGLRAALVLLVLTVLVSVPWWNHRKVRAGIPVTFHADFDAAERQMRLNQVRALLDDWTGFTSAGQLQGSRLMGARFTPWSVVLRVRFRRGMAVEDFTVRKLSKLESAFGSVRRKSVRVEPVDHAANEADIRLMLVDPHAKPIPLPDVEDLVIGLFETGDPVEFELINTVIAGQTGAGKSGVMNAIVCKLMRRADVALVGIDMKPGAVELSRYKPVMFQLASTPNQVGNFLLWYRGEMTRRGRIMEAQGIREWVPTPEDPFIVVLVDESQEVKRAGLGKTLDDCSALNRAYGGCIIAATQYPTKGNLSTTLKANAPQKIGVKTEDDVADRVIFGSNASKDGWRPSSIPGGRLGSFFIRNRRYSRPVLARAFWVSDETADAEVARWAPFRTVVGGPERHPDGSRVLPGDREPDIVDVVLVDDSGPSETYSVEPEEVEPTVEDDLVTLLRERGPLKPPEIREALGCSLATVYRRLKGLEGAGAVRRGDERGTWEIAPDPA